jgi:hypothetical protein
VPLGDPHDVRQLDNGRLLVVDAARNLVIEADWLGQVYWAAGDQDRIALNDPHSAQRLPTGDILICDTGNSRLIRMDSGGKIVHTLETIRAPSHRFRLIRPRYCEVAGDGVLLIADSDNNRILASTLEGEYLWVLSSIPDSRLSSLDQPRWVHAISTNELVVSDHRHHRILHLRRTNVSASEAT